MPSGMRRPPPWRIFEGPEDGAKSPEPKEPASERHHTRTVFYPEFGVLVQSSEKGPGRTLALQARSSEKEHDRTLVRSLDSELGKGTGSNPGSTGLEFGEPAEFGTCQTRVIPGPFSELRTTQPGLTRSKSDFQTETPNSEQKHNPGPS